MANDRSGRTTSTQPDQTRGYRPFDEGYQPSSAHASQNKSSSQKPPKPPKGGTGQTAPRINSAKGASDSSRTP